MPIERDSGNHVNKNGTASTTIASPPFTGLPDCLMVVGLMSSGGGSISTPSGWTVLLNALPTGSKRIAIFYRWATAADAPNFPFNPAFSASVLGADCFGYFTGVDPDNPFTSTASNGNSSGTTLIGPTLTADIAGCVPIWWWGAHFTASASSRPVTLPGDVSHNAGAAGAGRTTSTAATGVNMGSGFLPDVAAGFSGARSATIPASTAWSSIGTVLRPAPGAVINRQFHVMA